MFVSARVAKNEAVHVSQKLSHTPPGMILCSITALGPLCVCALCCGRTKRGRRGERWGHNHGEFALDLRNLCCYCVHRLQRAAWARWAAATVVASAA